MRNRSLRSDLLRGVTCTTLLVFGGAALLLYGLIRQSLWAEFDALLAAKARALAALVVQDGERIDVPFQEYPLQEFARQTRPEYYQVWDQDGAVLARSRRLDISDLKRVPGSLVRPGFCSAALPDGRQGRLATVRFFPHAAEAGLEDPLRSPSSPDDDDDDLSARALSSPARAPLTLVVARETSDIDVALRRARWTLACIFVAAGLLLHVILARVVAHRLQPLDRLAGQIDAISPGSLSQQLSLDEAPTELRSVVQRFNELMVRLQLAFTRERTFATDVAHELRTPLTGLRTILDVALSRPRSSEQYQGSIQECHSICDQTQRIVETLLTMARLESGRAVVDREIVDVAMVLEHAWQPFQPRAARRRVTVSRDIASGMLLTTDANQFRILFANLFDNAVSYVDDGGSINIKSHVDRKGLQIVVENTGCRLTSEETSRVFERFWRADASRGETGAHAGLGLALCQRIATLLQGAVDVVVTDGWFVVSFRFPPESVESVSCELEPQVWVADEAADALKGGAHIVVQP